MRSDRKRPGGKRYVSVKNARELQRWSRILEVEPEVLIEAVAAAGTRIEKVREYLVERHFHGLHPEAGAAHSVHKSA